MPKKFEIKNIQKHCSDLKPLEYYQENDKFNPLLLKYCSIDFNAIQILNSLSVKSYVFNVYLTARHLRQINLKICSENIKKRNLDKNILTYDQIEKSLLILCQSKLLTTTECDPKKLSNANFSLLPVQQSFQKYKIKNNFYNQKLNILKYTLEYYKKESSETNLKDYINSMFVSNVLFERPVTYSEIKYITGLNRYQFKSIKSLLKNSITTKANLKQVDSEILSGTENIINHNKINANIQTKTIYHKNYNPCTITKNKYITRKYPSIGNVFSGTKEWSNLVDSHKKLKYISESTNSEIIGTAHIILKRKCHASNFSFYTEGQKYTYTKRWEKTVLNNFHQKLYQGI